MKSQSPALTKDAMVATAGRKADKVQRKLRQAEAELHTANEILVKTPTGDPQKIGSAVKQNVAAEEKVHEATEELQVVKELLSEAQAQPDGTPRPPSSGQTGDGVKSLIPHLERARSSAAD